MKVIGNIDYSKVAELIKANNIVAIFQGKSEGGPRALGNRSLLFNPITIRMNDYVNKVKKRELYRPVAGTILLENASEWFHMLSLKESPYMTYAIDVIEEKISKIPAIVHKNNTCRIQTVTKEQNYHYYNLISAFKELTDVPILGNTSFNLGGEVIVETLREALDVIERSKIEYLYLPEKKSLIYSENK